MKHFLIVTLSVTILIFLLVLPSCKTTEKDSSQPTSSTGEQQDIPDELENGDVSMYLWEAPEADLKAFAKTFEEKYGGKVTFRLTTWGEMDTKVAMDMTSGMAPDLVWSYDAAFIRQAVNKIIQPLDDYININDPYWDPYMSRMKWRGKTYVGVVKNTLDQSLIFYNKTMFENNNVKTPLEYYNEGTWTYENFQTCATQITQKRGGETVVYGWSSFRMFDWIYGNNGAFVRQDKDGKVTVAMGETASINGMQFLKDAYQKYKYAKPDGNMTWVNDLQEGKAAMVGENSDHGFRLKKMTDEWDVVPLPLGPDNVEKKHVCVGAGWALSYAAPNLPGAVAYMKMYAEWLSSTLEAKLKTVYTDEQIARIQEAKTNPFDPQIECNFGVWGTSQYSFIFSIAGTQPVSQAVQEWTPILQAQINRTLNDAQ